MIQDANVREVRRLTVLHTLGWYFPESSGGTEVYAEGLTRNLLACGVDSILAAAHDGPASDYEWNQVPVHRYRVSNATPDEIATGQPHGGFDEFVAWLRRQDAEIYHQHTWTRGCGLLHLKAAKAVGMKTVVTVHVPGVLCLRGTMMLNGIEPCDGQVRVDRCTSCWGASRGIPRSIAAWQGRRPGASTALGRRFAGSRIGTALLTPSLVARHQAQVAELGSVADRVVAVSRWLHDALLANGIPHDKLVYCAQGIDSPAQMPTDHARQDDVFRVGFLGRWDRVKGVHILVEAFRGLPSSLRAELVVHGLAGDADYERHVRARADGDARIRFADPIARNAVFEALAGFDVLAVPSLWLETGPLVALEACAAGTPVIGSNMGGIAELVTPGVTGQLVPAGDVAAWRHALAEAATTRRGWRTRSTPRSSRQVAQEMSTMYRRLVTADAEAATAACAVEHA